MPKYKVLVKNPIEIGKFKSENGVLNVVSPTKEETKRIERAVQTGLLREPVTTKPAIDK